MNYIGAIFLLLALLKGQSVSLSITNDILLNLTKQVDIEVSVLSGLTGNITVTPGLNGIETLRSQLINYYRDLPIISSKCEDLYVSVKKWGYNIEEHSTITEDFYNLTIYRINKGEPKAGVCLLMHALLGSSDNYLKLGPDRSLALQLADRGCDVWLGNNRGNVYSRKNTRVDPSEKIFWDFSFEDMGSKDLPAIIDYILNVTGQEKLTYIGHSQGTTQAFALLAAKPEYNDKIKLAVFFAPVAYEKYIVNPLLRTAAATLEILEIASDLLNYNEFLRRRESLRDLLRVVCDSSLGLEICPVLVYLATGYSNQINGLDLVEMVCCFPEGTSLKTIFHYAQLARSGEFRMFDYGPQENLVRYGSSDPPSYNLSQITTPVALFWGRYDTYTSRRDIERVASELGNTILNYELAFNHLDFVIAKDINELLYDRVLDLIGNFTN